MRIDDFIVYGRTAPEKSKRYGVRICMAGYSEELRQMMRIYPIDIYSGIKDRDVLSVELERNKMDSRIESWALKDRTMQSVLKIKEPINKEQIKPFLKKHVVQSIKHLNENRLSLGILNPSKFEVIIKTRKKLNHPDQLLLFDDFIESGDFKTASEYFYAPYLKTENGCLQIRSWGLYELLRKYDINGKHITPEDITNALHIGGNKDIFIVVGNMNHIRNSWLIIKIFSFKKEDQLSLF